MPVGDTTRKPARPRRVVLRAWLRALHRDAGYLAVGLTFVYAFSGLAVNHIADWDPNFVQVESTRVVDTPLPEQDDAAALAVLEALGYDETPLDVYRIADDRLDVTLERITLHVDPRTGEVFEEGEHPRVFLRMANWLHLNRGKKAWTWVADGYAVLLLFLASSGVFMLGGRKGLLGRGAVLVGLGVAIPIVYVVLSGGP